MLWAPSTDYRYSLKKGMEGSDVAALQLNLPELEADGLFGRKTKQAVEQFQSRQDLVVDGVAGLLTQQRLCVALSSEAARAEDLPVGLLKSLMSNESGFAVGAVSRHPSDAGLDVGAYQRSTGSGEGSQDFYEHAYNVAGSAQVTAQGIRRTHDEVPGTIKPSRYLDELADRDPDVFRWQLAVLNHNWPVAAYNIPRYGVIYQSDVARDDREAEWIVIASAGRLRTPREWVASYIQRATTYARLG